MFNAYIDHVAPAFEYLATNITETTKTFRKMSGKIKKTLVLCILYRYEIYQIRFLFQILR